METNEPPLDKPDDFDYNRYIYEHWSNNSTFIKATPMLSFMRRVREWIPNELHRATLKDAMQAMEYRNDQLARTTHAHVIGIMKKNLKFIFEKAQGLMNAEDYGRFEKEFNDGIALAEKLESECRRRAEERQKKDRDGNIVWKVKEKPLSEKAG